MRAEDRDPAHLWDMIRAARSAVEYIGDTTIDGFVTRGLAPEMLRMAVERQLEILGEAARRVSPALREAHPNIPWRETIGLRNLISHEYDKVDYREVYRIVSTQLPELIEALHPLIPPVPPSLN